MTYVPQVFARATLQRDVTLSLGASFLPPVVLKCISERSAGGGAASDIVAWKFDPACVLQSDIVGASKAPIIFCAPLFSTLPTFCASAPPLHL